MEFSLKTKVSTPKLAEMRAFYETVFGMEIVEEWNDPDDKGVILAFQNGRSEAYLEIYDAAESYDFSGVSLQFKVDDLTRFIATLPENVSYEGPKPRPWGSTYLYLRDPENILIIIYEGGL